MQKTDLTKLYKSYYSAKNTPELVETEAAAFLSLAGKGDPSGESFAADIQALYATAYTLKFMYKATDQDFVVAKLEGLWDFDEQLYSGFSLSEAPIKIPRKDWRYRLLIRLPEFVRPEDITEAANRVLLKKQLDRALDISFFNLPESKAVQMLHTGPFDKEVETLRQIQAFISARNLQKNGLHHEIYLSDFRKTPKEKLRTILREPVK
ncbi:hypothetical protein EDD80_101555 [Anseongella ginsenosidimutans]|uniref:GyrI-like small molecule binding domain-containing protein n=1 Tax=Anseongella ginsenosidimutans TaxID=496056 RepID=A0A4R3KXD7_9SPHI|nr:GyrI-like domain-containing protein [Anseongella ginsenosidimutans]QEC50993.1 hypothetical protein FRZ59_00595 [Anseongella ginsenosidimutans]TCS90355.1 hypothetical protein EDD80_101555 [Anseongella ginsenosidimutans]